MQGSSVNHTMACHEVVTQLMAKYDWQLLDENDFACRLLERSQAADQQEPAMLTKLAINLYCENWYQACNTLGACQQRAYLELAHYLYDRALHKYHDRDLAHEITHDAIILVYEQILNCRNPGAFMAFALLKLWNAATTYFRRRDRQAKRMTELAHNEMQDHGIRSTDSRMPTPDEKAVMVEQASELVTRLGELIRAFPRAEKQFQAVLYKYLNGYSDNEIASILETDVANVHVLRSRGLKRLRADPVLHEMARNLPV